MESKIFIEENGVYQIDCSSANELIQLHETYNKNSILSDVDAIIVLDDAVIFMEYKNSSISNEVNPEAFKDKLISDKHYMSIARKYYDSTIYLSHKSNSAYKKRRYYYVLECDIADSFLRKRLAAKIKRKLPFELQDKLNDLVHNLIDEFAVVSIEEWNEIHPDLQLVKCIL